MAIIAAAMSERTRMRAWRCLRSYGPGSRLSELLRALSEPRIDQGMGPLFCLRPSPNNNLFDRFDAVGMNGHDPFVALYAGADRVSDAFVLHGTR
jgi:hypothetical protein